MSDQVLEWHSRQRPEVLEKVQMAVSVLAVEGPALGRPLVDSIVGSSIRNLKELRVSSSSHQAIRILFCFTPERTALLLVAGDKSNNWSNWYLEAISEAEEIYEHHLEN
jgi:hypothetical protein